LASLRWHQRNGVFQKVYAFHPSLHGDRFLKERLQTQTILRWFKQDHIPQDLLLLTILD
jgi:hypothetical protein